MKRTKEKLYCFLVLTFCITLGLFPSAGAKTLPKTAKLVPPETAFLLDIDNFQQLKQQYEKTSFYQLYKDPAMAAFVENFKAKLHEKMRQTDNEIARAIIDSDILPLGRVAFGLVLNEQIKNRELPVLFITQWGTNTPKIKDAVEKTVKKAVETGSRRRTEDYRGINIVTIITERPPIQVPKPDTNPAEYNDFSMQTIPLPPTETSYCFIDDCLIGADNIEVLKFIIAQLKGSGSPTLADDTDYTATIAALGPYHDIDIYINIKQIIKITIAQDPTGTAKTMISNLGLDNVASFGNSLGLTRRPGSSCSGKMFLKINGAKKGVCKMLEPELAALKAPKFIPASVYSVLLCNLNVKKVYDELYSIMYSFNPIWAAKMHAPILPPGPDGQPSLQLKADIIDHLGSQIVVSQSINKLASETAMPTESILALAVNNRTSLEKSLSLLHSKVFALNNPDAKRQLLGHSIYLVSPQFFLPFFGQKPMPMQTPPLSAAPQLPTPAFTVTDTHLILGTEDSVERAIRTLSSTGGVSVESAKWYSSAKTSMPSVVGLACLQDNAASGEFYWRLMKETGKTKTANLAMGPNPGLILSQTDINFALLPPFDAVRKYFGPSTLYGISKSEGFFFEFNYLKPAAD